MTQIYVHFRINREIISNRLRRVYFFCRLYGYDAASAFFSFIPSQFDKKWRTSVLVSGLITFYCRSTLFLHERLASFGESQHSFV
jgi:hypothetical protein